MRTFTYMYDMNLITCLIICINVYVTLAYIFLETWFWQCYRLLSLISNVCVFFNVDTFPKLICYALKVRLIQNVFLPFCSAVVSEQNRPSSTTCLCVDPLLLYNCVESQDCCFVYETVTCYALSVHLSIPFTTTIQVNVKTRCNRTPSYVTWYDRPFG